MKVLIADDSPGARFALRRNLDQWGHDIVEAEDGDRAWGFLTGPEPPDMAILDWMMPGKEGVDICRELQARPGSHFIYTILLTSKSEKQDLIHALDQGAHDFLSKPVHPPELRSRMDVGMRLVEMHKTLENKNHRLEEEIHERRSAQLALAEANARLKEANRELERLARVDGLTQVANRLLFDECLDREWKRQARDKKPLALILMDIDFFKRYNDTYGHLAGDECLQRVAGCAQALVNRPADLLARFGGEEFAVVLPGTDARGAASLAEKIREKVSGLGLDHPASDIKGRVTLSLGVASVIPDHSLTPKDLIKAADQALYTSKEKGRNRVTVKGE